MILLRLSWYNGSAWSAVASFSTLGYEEPKLHLRSKAVSTFIVRIAGGDPTAAATIPFEAPVRIYGTLAGMNGGVETIIFQGRRTDLNGLADPLARGVDMVFSDGWYDLERIIFQHHWQAGAGPTLSYFSRINLFQDISGGPGSAWGFLTINQQLAEIITYAQTNCGALVQAGTFDPTWQMPYYPVKAITCADAILTCLQTVADCVTWFDYTTTPPTVHMRQRANCTALTLPYASTDGNGVTHKSSAIKPRPDLQASQVVIQYWQTNVVGNLADTSFINDVYPALSTGQAIRALVAPIDLRGVVAKDVQGTVTSQFVDPTTTAFWTKFKKDLGLADVSALSITSTTINGGGTFDITIKDESGTNVSIATYPNEIISGQVAPWMKAGATQIVAKEVTITGYINYTKNVALSSGNVNVQVVKNHPVSVRVKLSNSAAGAVPYSALASFTSAEPVPTGLAQNIYTALNTLQYEGNHVILEQNTFQIIGPSMVLNLSGGGASWTSMNAAIYDTEIDFFHGRTTVNFGPHQHLSAQQFFDLVTLWTWRRIWENPSVRNTGVDTQGGPAILGNDTQKENTQHGLPQPQVMTGYSFVDGAGTNLVPTGSMFMIQHDAANQAIVAQAVDNTGAVLTAQPQVNAKMVDLGVDGGTGLGRIAKWRNWTQGATTIKVLASDDATIGGFSYRGTYNSATTYALYDVVRVQSGSSQGVWVCVIANPTSSHQPTYPEPALTGGTNYWEMLAFGIQSTSVCSGGTKTMDFNATAPY